MSPKSTLRVSVAALAAVLVYAPVSHAFNFGNMMNPSRWLGGDRDRYGDDYYDDFYPGVGPYGPPGFGYPYGGYAPGYGAPYAAPGYGAPAPGYHAPPAYPAAPAPAPSATPGAAPAVGVTTPAESAEIQALKRRVEELEAQQKGAAPVPPPASEWPGAPAFRPMNQY